MPAGLLAWGLLFFLACSASADETRLVAVLKSDLGLVQSEPFGALGQRFSTRLFWQPLLIVEAKDGRIGLTQFDNPRIFRVESGNVIELPSRVFFVPPRMTTERLLMRSNMADGFSTVREVATPGTTPMPPSSIMPYPVLGLATDGRPLLLAPHGDVSKGHALQEWTLEADSFPSNALHLLVHRQELENYLVGLSAYILSRYAALPPKDNLPLPPRWPETIFPSSLKRSIPRSVGTENVMASVLTRKFQTLYRLVNNSAESKWHWIPLDILPDPFLRN